MRIHRVGCALLLWAGAAFPQSKVSRDWAKHPAIVQIDTTEDIFAVGDVHGDYDRLVKLLSAAGIIEIRATESRTVTWIAGRAVLLFTGDLIDKGPHSVEVLRLVRSLRDSSARQGGQVVILMGNHEAEFLADPTANKVKDFANDLRAGGLTPADVAACRGDVGQLMCLLPFGARVCDWFFSHAGNTGGRTLSQLTADLQNGVSKDGFGSKQLVGQDSMLEARIGEEGPGGKSWFEVDGPHRSAEQLLARYTAALGVAHLVQGHQHQAVLFDDSRQRNAGEMFQWRGLIFLIDVGMSEGVGDSQGAVLHIQSKNGQKAVAICADGRKTTIWDNVQNPKSGRATACGSPQ
ncbi:MAG: metallophosphoesterase [Bryobacterales bacterium]|nr:metallophosphoesterase [Bryobacterales bacterium]